MEKLMAEMTTLATPGPEHAEIAKRVGTWTVKYKHQMGPDAPWTESEGLTHAKTILDGRYLYEESTINLPDFPPMKGVHIFGYNNKSGEYESHWMDTMSTWMVHSSGKPDSNGVIQLKGTMVDVMGARPFRMVIKDLPDGTSMMEMYDTIPPKGETMVMTAHSRRN